MSFDEIISRCIALFSDATSIDPCCLKRYESVVTLLNEMKAAIMAGTYPRSYSVLPICHYVERNMDSDEMYDSIKMLDKWYADNYRNKSEAVLRREAIKNYLLSENNLSERRADMTISKLAKHKDIYLEFSDYVAKRAFPEDGLSVEGYTAKILNQNYPLSPLGGYNYLIYLREMPDKALADLKAGLPTKDSTRFEKFIDQEEVQGKMDEKITTPVEEIAEPQKTPAETPAEQTALLEKLDAVQQALAALQQTFNDKIAEDTHKNSLFDNMHRELVRYQNGALDKIVDTIALDIIQLVDTTKGHVRVYDKKEPTEENYKKLLRIVKGIAEDLEDILYRQNIESYRVPGHEVDTRRQKIIQTVPTDDKSKDNLIAVRAADGYEKGDKVLRPERIKIFKYEAPATKPTENN